MIHGKNNEKEKVTLYTYLFVPIHGLHYLEYLLNLSKFYDVYFVVLLLELGVVAEHLLQYQNFLANLDHI